MASVAPPSPPSEVEGGPKDKNWVEDLERAENRPQDNTSSVRNEIRAFFHYCREKLDARERLLMSQLDDNCQRISSYLNVQRTKLLTAETTQSKRGLFSISEADCTSPREKTDETECSFFNDVDGQEKERDPRENGENSDNGFHGKVGNGIHEEEGDIIGNESINDNDNDGPVIKFPQRRKHLLRKIRNSPEINLSLADSEARKAFSHTVGNLGLVYAGRADPSRTVACCRPALVKAKCTGKIKAIDKHGHECRKGRDDIVAFLEAPSGNVTKCNVTDCRNGTYNLTFVPNELGRHKLHVKVSGVPLKSGPLEIYARFVRIHVKSAFLGGSCIFALEIPSDYELNWQSDSNANEGATTLTPQMLGIGVRDPDQKETRCTIIGCTEKIMGVARYNVRFFPLKPGDHEISVALQGGPTLLQQVIPVQAREQIGSRGSGEGQMFSPTDIAVSQDGTIFVADTVENSRIQRYSTTGEYLSSFAVDRQEPSILTVDNQHVAVLFQGSMEVRLYAHDGSKGGSFTVAVLKQPTDIAITGSGQIAIIDRQLNELRLLGKGGKLERLIGKEGAKPGEFKEPYHLCVNTENHIFISEHGNRRVQEIDGKGSYVKELRSKEKMSEPGSIAITTGGHLLVFDEKERKVQIVNLDENRFSGCLSVDLLEPRTARMATTPDGFLIVLDMFNNCLWRYRIPFES